VLVKNIPARVLTNEESQERAIALFLVNAPDQQRPVLRPHPILVQVARLRAQDMARRRYFSHVSPDGTAANYLVEKAGYRLPAHYDHRIAANNIESIAAGNENPDRTWRQWMNSPPHRRHVLELDNNWADVHYGVGYAFDAGSPYRHYWVVLTARPGP
jgi:uncharacterized protein YkwD